MESPGQVFSTGRMPNRYIAFGVFEVDLDAGELRKRGRLIHVQQQPFEVLRALLLHPNDIVTRDQLRDRLWPDGVTVDFDQSLNKCITRLRSALGDSAENPRFIETLPKRGYRFIASTFAREDHERAAADKPEAPLAPLAPSAPLAPPAPLVPPASAFARGDQERASVDRPLWSPSVVIPVATMAILIATLLAATRPEMLSPTVAAANADAQDAYMRARTAMARRSDEALQNAVGLFERSIAADPRFAPAHAGLADAWSLLGSYGVMEPADAMTRAREAANRALTLDPALPEAYATLGRIAMIYDWDWRTAERQLVHAVRLRPGYATAHQWRAYALSAAGRHDEAVQEARRAVAIEPLSLNTNTGLGYVLYAARRFDDAAAQLADTLEVDPDFRQARRNLALVRAAQGRTAEAVDELERVARLSHDSPASLAELAWARGRMGDSDGARTLLQRIDRTSRSGYLAPDTRALALVGAGRIDDAVASLQAAFAARVAGIVHLATDPMWDGLRDDPRVREMVAAIGPQTPLP